MKQETLEFKPGTCYCRSVGPRHRHFEFSPTLGLYLDLEHWNEEMYEGEMEGGLIRLTVHWSLFEQLPGPEWVETGGLEFVRDYGGDLVLQPH